MRDQIRFLEEIAANGHVALNTMMYDGWMMRFSGGYTGRANSVSVLYPSTKELPEKVAYCEACYAKQGLPAMFKITDGDAELEAYLLERGYSVVTPTDVMILDLDGTEPPADPADCVFAAEAANWLPEYFRLEELADPVKQDIFRRMVAKVQADTIYCTVTRDGKAAACASAAIEQGYMLLQNVIVDASLRGTGLGEKMCRAVIARGKEQGAGYAYLQVVQTNTAALGLYRKLGFRKVYTYRYLKQPAAVFGEPADIDDWMRLVRLASPEFPGLETEQDLEDHRQTVLKFMGKRQAVCVKVRGEIAGVLLFSRNRNMICCLAVSPEHRRKGIAGLLMDKALGELDRDREITVSTFREGDEKGTAPRALYQKYGFLEGGLTEEYGYPNQVLVLPARPM